MNAAYKFRVYPNEEQRTMIAKTIGCCRFVYHHMLADKIAYYEEQKAWAGVCFAAEGYPSVYAGVSVDRHFCGNAGFLVSKYSGKAGLDSFPSVLSHLHGVEKCLLRDTCRQSDLLSVYCRGNCCFIRRSSAVIPQRNGKGGVSMKGLRYQLKSVLKDKFCLMTFLLSIVVAAALHFVGSIDFSELGELHFQRYRS